MDALAQLLFFYPPALPSNPIWHHATLTSVAHPIPFLRRRPPRDRDVGPRAVFAHQLVTSFVDPAAFVVSFEEGTEHNVEKLPLLVLRAFGRSGIVCADAALTTCLCCWCLKCAPETVMHSLLRTGTPLADGPRKPHSFLVPEINLGTEPSGRRLE
ncbi:hypothetical protein AURDEDRAFT_177218 [Auricularia subglabra TFB-10046 SS5]|uniref:Uncharacterized protein n=1 Tax=Auricularia subglabra (strain TFB-10046 / SS5) TaxID=717982 RepID=J0WPB0_AURST|nr:hypothetical protein AURDEDRAFT_177218 [Auricularia subglabra TFB-10046 SS5]